ncbi:hypothetical protein BDR03DRAFT_1018745 [Suillus americanus]|nr:hypothetical protein BDR03DRAFT_1018745 [Suillus americanus]
MQTFNSNVDSPSVPATTGETQTPLDVIVGDGLGLEIVASNIDSPSVSATTSSPREPSDAIIGENSGLKIVRNSASYRQPQLVEEKADIVQSNTLHTSFSPPIWRLPTEILSEIFLYCLPEDEHLVYASRLAPLLLTRICRQWREVAVSLPKLWCRLQLEVGYDDWPRRAFHLDNWETRAFGYDSWLKRSGGGPLSLRLTCRSDWSVLQTLLQPYIQQISSLSLNFHSYHGTFMMEDFHTLKELAISKYMSVDDPAQVTSINRSLSKLPVNLRKIKIKGIWFNRTRLDLFAASGWGCLTHIEMRMDGLDAFTRTLRLCPNLCSLKMTGVPSRRIRTPESVMHTNLQSLSMSWNIDRNMSENLDLFKVITLPNLRVLEARRMGRWPHDSFMRFLTRSEYPLERLVFDVAVWTTARERAEYATLVPSFELIADPGGNFDVDE